MTKKIMLALMLFVTVMPSASFALGECRDDRKKFCPDAGLDEDKIKTCLKANYKDLSAPCKDMIDKKIEQKVEQKLENQSK